MYLNLTLSVCATETSSALISRLAIINMVHEARGLDTYPLSLQRFQRAGDQASVDILNRNFKEEIDHVACGVKWFSYLCDKNGLNPVSVFKEQVRIFIPGGRLKGPLNTAARDAAGLTCDWYQELLEPGTDT